MWIRIKGWLQRQWALKTSQEKGQIKLKMVASLITLSLFLIGFWSVFELDTLLSQLVEHYWAPLQVRLRDEGLRLALLLVSALISVYAGWQAIRQTLARAQSWDCETLQTWPNLRWDADYKKSAYQVSSTAPIVNRFLYSPAVNRELILADEIPFTMKKEAWSLKSPGTELLPFAVSEATRRGALIFDEPKIRLNTDLLLNEAGFSTSLVLQRTRYFYSLATNDISFKKIHKRREEWDPEVSPFEREIYDGVSLFAQPDAHSQSLFIKKLIDSGCSNHIGVSTLAITADGSLIITGQSATNAQSGNTWAPSGSGSADWKDAKQSRDLLTLIQRGAERELIEECGLPKNVSLRTFPLGFARNLQRGGKPEFFCLTLLSLRAADLRLKHQEGEKVFTAYNVYDSLPQKIDFRPEFLVSSIESFRERFATKLSGPMALALDMLRDAVMMPEPVIRSALESLDLSHPWHEVSHEKE